MLGMLGITFVEFVTFGKIPFVMFVTLEGTGTGRFGAWAVGAAAVERALGSVPLTGSPSITSTAVTSSPRKPD